MIAIIGAMDNEVAFYKTVLTNMEVTTISNQEFFIGKIGKQDICLTKCGIGKVSSTIVTSLLINNFNPKLIINTGIAGGTSTLKTSDIFIANKYIYGDFDLRQFGYKKGQVPGSPEFFEANKKYTTLLLEYFKDNNINYNTGLIVTQDSFITSYEQLDKYDELIATDMEGASIAHTCHYHNIPFFSIRIISDVIGSEEQVDNYQEFEDKAAELSSKVTYNFIKELK